MTVEIRKTIEEFSQSELFHRISEICAAVNVVTNDRDLLETSLQLTMELFGAERGSIFLLKENRTDLILKIARGMAQNEEEKMVKRLGQGVVGQVAANKKPVIVKDIAADDRFQNFKARKSYRTPSFICAPLLVKDALLGVINIADKETGSNFGENELQLLDFLATQIALNYRRVQLYQKFKTIVKESQCLKDELGKSSQETTHLKKKIVLQEKLATVGKLAGGIAHEFNNPLDGVLRYTNLCLEHSKGEETCDVCRGYLLEIKGGLNRMANIVKSLLSCSRNTAPTMKKIDPGQAIEQAIEAVQPEILAKNIALERDVGTNLPKLTDLGLDRIVINLLHNAVDAVAEKGRIKLVGQQDFDRFILEVRDNGTGIPPEAVEMIFEPFYTTKDIAKGCGLGLTIVSEIVKAYNGQINVESVPGEGTTFTITLPII